MPIPLSLIQQTVNFIVKQCRHQSKKGPEVLTASAKRHLAAEMTEFILNGLNLKPPRTKPLILGRGNPRFQSYIDSLDENNIIFPSRTTYLLYCNGISYQKANGQKLEIVNLRRNKREVAALQASAIVERLADVTFLDRLEEATNRLEKISITTDSETDQTLTAAMTPGYLSIRKPITLGDFIPTEWREKFGLDEPTTTTPKHLC